MYYVLTIVFGIITAGLTLSILVGAFRQSAGQGLLCLFVPFYSLYFAFTKWTFDKRAAVAGGCLAATGAFVFCTMMAIKTAAADTLAVLQQASAAGHEPAATAPATAPATAAVTTGKLPIVATCAVRYGSHGLLVCTETHGTSVPATTSEKCKEDGGTFAAGSTPCPSDGATGKCEYAAKSTAEGARTEVFYPGSVGNPKGSCELLGAIWTSIAPATNAAANPRSTRAPDAPKPPRRK